MKSPDMSLPGDLQTFCKGQEDKLLKIAAGQSLQIAEILSRSMVKQCYA